MQPRPVCALAIDTSQYANSISAIPRCLFLGLHWPKPSQCAVCNAFSRSSDLRAYTRQHHKLHGMRCAKRYPRLAFSGAMHPMADLAVIRLGRAYSGGTVWDSHPVPLSSLTICKAIKPNRKQIATPLRRRTQRNYSEEYTFHSLLLS